MRHQVAAHRRGKPAAPEVAAEGPLTRVRADMRAEITVLRGRVRTALVRTSERAHARVRAEVRRQARAVRRVKGAALHGAVVTSQSPPLGVRSLSSALGGRFNNEKSITCY